MKLHILSNKNAQKYNVDEIIELCIKSYSTRPGLEPDTSSMRVQHSTDIVMALHGKLRNN